MAHEPYPIQVVHLGLALYVGFIVGKHLEPETVRGGWVRAAGTVGEEPCLEHSEDSLPVRSGIA